MKLAMKHRAFALWEVLLVLLVLAVLAALLFSNFFRRPPPARRSRCQSNLKQIGLGFLQYAQDAGEKFPPATPAWGWAIQPYVKDWAIFHCPAVNASSADQTTDYFYNARLSRVKMEDCNFIALTILAGEGSPEQAPNYSLPQLPAPWMTDPSSPAQRHQGTANYLFADGHVKSLKPGALALQKPSKHQTARSQPTFSTK